MITGYFISVEVPEVAVGQDIKATIDFSALNPGALYWSTFLVADSPGLGLKRLLDKARELGQEGGRKKTYTLGKMPDKAVSISFFIFAHDDAGYDWDWGEYQDWMIGFPIELTHLDSDFKFLSPGEEPPPPPDDVSGIITRAAPSQFVVGQPIDLEIDFNAYMESVYYQARGWETSLQAVIDGKSDSDAQTHWGRDGSRTGESLHLGAMPDRTLTGTLTLYGRGMAIPQKDWQTLDTKDLVITASGEEPPPPPDDVSGIITRVVPSQFLIGRPIDLEIDFNAYMESVYYQVRGWETNLQAVIDGLSDNDAQTHWGRDGSRTGESLHLGAMPDRTLTGTLTLRGRGMAIPQQSWQVLDTKDLVITASGEEPPECSIDSDCPEGYVCRNGVCVPDEGPPECAIDSDCPPGYWCLNGVCVPDEGPPITCSIDSDCPEGYKCQDGVCVKKKWWETGWLLPAAIVGAALLLVPGKKTKKGK